MEAIIKTNQLCKRYKDKIAVDCLNLEIFKGEVFALLGPNGAGKTTTIKMLSCLATPSSGTAVVCGNDIIKQVMSVKEVIAVSPQETAVAKNLTALENLEMIADICKKDKASAKALAERFNLMQQPKLKAKKLSGGNQRRLSIAMALITDPQVLFLDEPTLGLDIEARYELWRIIKELKTKCTIVLTTHYLEEAEALADRMGVIKDGKLVELDTPVELRKKYTKPDEANVSIDEIYMRIVHGGTL